MKKILFLVNTYKDKYQLFVEAGHKLGVTVSIHTYHEISADLNSRKENDSSLKINGQSLKSFDLVYLRTLIKSPELQMIISQECRAFNIPIIDPVFAYHKPFIDGKAFAYLQLIQSGLPVIESLFLSIEHQDQIAKLKFPVVAKTSGGSQGKNVHLCHSKNELETIFNQYSKPLLIQPFIENSGDVRLHIMGGKFVAGIKRTSQSGEFRNNTSLGGTASGHQPSPEEVGLAIQATEALNLAIAGVDLIYDQKLKQWFIMEVNRAPQFSNVARISGVNIPLETIKYFMELI